MRNEPAEKERFEVLLEEIRSNVKTIGEGVVNVDQKLDRIHGELKEDINRVENKVDVIEKVVTSINNQLSPMQYVLSDHEKRITKLEAV